MTGTYASFKGKLKVGDRVRIGEARTARIVNVNDEGFSYKEEEVVNGWEAGGSTYWSEYMAMELLSPSPRVVTDTEAPSLPLIAKFTVKARGSVDYNNIIKMTNPTDKDVYAMVWDASPPATAEAAFSNVRCYDGPMSREQFEKILKDSIERKPAPAEKEEEWWMEHDPSDCIGFSEGQLCCLEKKEIMEPIIAEAKCRGAEEAWKEAKCIIEAQKKYRGIISTAGGDFILLVRLVEAIDAKLESLNKPAGAGEK